MNKAISAEIRMCRHSRYGHSHISLFEVEVVKAELPEPGGNGGRSMLGQMRLRSDDDSKTLGGHRSSINTSSTYISATV